VGAASGHPAILAYSLGCEISAALVRSHGRGRVERYLRRLYRVVKAEDPTVMVTYVNYPSAEHLRLPFLDFYCFTVDLESQDRFGAYLEHLHKLAGACPLVIAEIGPDGYRNGKDPQTRVLEWEIREAFRRGCAGVFVYSWTNEWYRGRIDAIPQRGNPSMMKRRSSDSSHSSAADRATASPSSRSIDPEPVWYTVSQLSRRWQLDRKTIYKFIDSKILPAWKVGTHVYRVAAEDILRFEGRNRLRQK
jgi:excisionase family DNA binding protein